MKFSEKLFLAIVLLLVISCTKDEQSPGSSVPEKIFYKPSEFVMGVDLSYTNAVQDFGGVYKDSGAVKDPFTIFRDHGANLVRVRLWKDPDWQNSLNGGKIYGDLQDVEKTIGRAKASGMIVNLDLHYSDTWADVGKQEIPAAWSGLSLNVLKDSVYQYTLALLNELKAKNLVPEMIQIGNETNGGMLFPSGQVVADNWTAFGLLLNSGIKAIRDFSAGSVIKPQIILHVAQLQNADWWVNGILNKAGVTDFDVVGISHYYTWSTLATMNDIGNTISSVRNKYGKKIMIVEVSYPWTSANADSYPNIISGSTSFAGYAVSKDGQYRYMKDLTQQVINGGGIGVMYWEPSWITSSLKDPWGTGSSFDNNTLFDFSGNTLQALDYMTWKYSF